LFKEWHNEIVQHQWDSKHAITKNPSIEGLSIQELLRLLAKNRRMFGIMVA